MTALMPVVADLQDVTVVERAEALVVAAADHLRLPGANLPKAALGCLLDELSQLLEQRTALSAESTDDSTETAELLISILRVRCGLLDHELSRRVRYLSEIRNALGDLRGLSPREMIYAAPVLLSREFGFARTMISTVRGSVWRPQHLFIEDERADPYSRPFLEYIRGAQIQLADAPLEAELVRKRCGAVVPSPKDDKRTFKEIVNVSGCVTMTLWHERNPAEHRSPGPAGSSRLRMKPTLAGTGHVDGAWWPATDELAGALPDLIAVLAPQLRPITHVMYHPHGWTAGVPRRVSRGKQAVRLDGYHYQPADTIDLIGEDGTRLVLLVVPATTDPRVAESILSAAADSHDVSTTSELLALRTEDTVEPDDSIAAQQNWESEGGKSIRVPEAT